MQGVHLGRVGISLAQTAVAVHVHASRTREDEMSSSGDRVSLRGVRLGSVGIISFAQRAQCTRMHLGRLGITSNAGGAPAFPSALPVHMPSGSARPHCTRTGQGDWGIPLWTPWHART